MTNEDVQRVKYDTKDFNLAAVLWCQKGVDLTNHAPQDPLRPREIYFTFEFTDMTHEEVYNFVYNYMNGKCSVEPQAFTRAQASLKHLIHSK